MPDFPVHEDLEVIDGDTTLNSDKWWEAVVLYEGFSGPEVAVYLWKHQDGDWTRQQKYKADRERWSETREAIERYLAKITAGEFPAQ